MINLIQLCEKMLEDDDRAGLIMNGMETIDKDTGKPKQVYIQDSIDELNASLEALEALLDSGLYQPRGTTKWPMLGMDLRPVRPQNINNEES